MLDSQVFEIMDCLSMRHRIMKRSGTLELLTFSIFAEGQTKEFCLYGDFIEKEICFTQFTCRCAFNCKLHVCLEYADYLNGTSIITLGGPTLPPLLPTPILFEISFPDVCRYL